MSALPQLAYESALREADAHERALGELRQRTSALLTASSLTASFLGSQAIARADRWGPWHGAAIAALVLSTGLAVYLLAPRVMPIAVIRPSTLVHDFADDRDPDLYIRLALSLEQQNKRSIRTLDAMQSVLTIVSMGLIGQLLSWTAALAGTVA